jgi:hypothetical protein
MRAFVIKRNIQRFYREKWWVRAVAAVLIMAAALLLVYLVRRFADQPAPVNVESLPAKFGPAGARAKLEEILIEGPLFNSASEPLLSYLGQPDEVVKLRLTRARLAPKTIALLRGQSADGEPPPPTGDVEIDYLPLPGRVSAKRPTDAGDPCTTSLWVELADAAKPPTRIHFFQTEGLGSDQQRLLAMTADTELSVRLQTAPPPDRPDALGCDKQLRAGNWDLANASGPWSLTFMVTAGSRLIFTIEPFDPKSPPWRKDESFRSFEFSGPISVQAVHINPLAKDGTLSTSVAPIRSARSVADLPRLRVDSLAIGSDDLQLNVLGKGFIESEDAPASSPLEQATSNPIVKLLLGAVGAAFIGWWLRLVYRLFSRQS